MDLLQEVSDLYEEVKKKCELSNMTVEFAGYIKIRPKEGGDVNGLRMTYGNKNCISDELEEIREDVINKEGDFIG